MPRGSSRAAGAIICPVPDLFYARAVPNPDRDSKFLIRKKMAASIPKMGEAQRRHLCSIMELRCATDGDKSIVYNVLKNKSQSGSVNSHS
jgi:hypothetical protein